MVAPEGSITIGNATQAVRRSAQDRLPGCCRHRADARSSPFLPRWRPSVIVRCDRPSPRHRRRSSDGDGAESNRNAAPRRSLRHNRSMTEGQRIPKNPCVHKPCNRASVDCEYSMAISACYDTANPHETSPLSISTPGDKRSDNAPTENRPECDDLTAPSVPKSATSGRTDLDEISSDAPARVQNASAGQKYRVRSHQNLVVRTAPRIVHFFCRPDWIDDRCPQCLPAVVSGECAIAIRLLPHVGWILLHEKCERAHPEQDDPSLATQMPGRPSLE